MRDQHSEVAAGLLIGYATNVSKKPDRGLEAKLNKVVTWHLEGFHS